MEQTLYDLMDWAGIEELVYSEGSNPHGLLGPHLTDSGLLVQALIPTAQAITVKITSTGRKYPMELADEAGFYAALIPRKSMAAYTLIVTYDNGATEEIHDPYSYAPQYTDEDVKKFNAGLHYGIYEKMGAHPMTVKGVEGVYFSVWAPCAMRVSVVGDFNLWDGRRHPMRLLGDSGIFELFIPGLKPGQIYKYEIKTKAGLPMLKADPYANYAELRPDTASIVWDIGRYQWQDREWMEKRAKDELFTGPVSIYEVHLGSWKRKELELENVYIIPLSATEGDNVTKKSENIPWYDGVPLLEYLENVDIHSDSHEKGFYMPVQRVCRPDHTFRGFQGQIEAGTVRVGDSITTLPSNETATVKGILMTDQSVDEAFEGQPVTISLDKEVDVSRGCVFVKDADVAVYKKLTVSLLWMDDEPLSIGKDYLVKLGTKLIPGILTKVDYAIDVNTGAHQETDTLEKNGIAVCEILLTEGIVADLFSNHKVLGELILIDRVTNMTSACGVVDAVSEKVSSTADRNSFQYGDLKARGDIFEEFYYDTESLNVLKYNPVSQTYTVGDEIPTSGDSYHYPDSFDCIVLRDGVAVRIRDKKITAILPASEYTYDNVPVINGRGFEVLVHSAEEAKAFLSEYAQTGGQDQAFFSKWMHFDTYRKVVFPQQ